MLKNTAPSCVSIFSFLKMFFLCFFFLLCDEKKIWDFCFICMSAFCRHFVVNLGCTFCRCFVGVLSLFCLFVCRRFVGVLSVFCRCFVGVLSAFCFFHLFVGVLSVLCRHFVGVLSVFCFLFICMSAFCRHFVVNLGCTFCWCFVGTLFFSFVWFICSS